MKIKSMFYCNLLTIMVVFFNLNHSWSQVLKEGEYDIFFKNGKIEKKRRLIGNKNEGVSFEQYYENGQLREKEESFPMNCNGKWEIKLIKSEKFYDNGAIESKGYKDPKGSGAFIEERYRINGVIEKKYIYKPCKFDWDEMEYNQNGDLIKTTKLVNGVVINVKVGNEVFSPKTKIVGQAQKNQPKKPAPKSSQNISSVKPSVVEEGNKFCFDDSYGSGNKFELRLIDGGDAKIIIKNRSNEIIRTGQGSWTGSNDGPGGNPPVISLILSTGRLKFTAIVDGYSSSINMIIDSKNNQWVKCW
jgi:hypothetical protein